MIFGKRKLSTASSWEIVREQLRLLRGKNMLRAREEAIPARDELILYEEHRGGLKNSYWVLSITPIVEDIIATHFPTKEILSIEKLGRESFFDTLASRLRGKAYVRSQKKGTEYR